MNDFHTVNDVYSAKKSITSKEIISHLEHLIEINSGKKVVVFLDNAKMHTSAEIQEFYLTKKNVLKLIFLPRYSPTMNPQENVWNYFKSKLFRPASRCCVEELVFDTQTIFNELNSDTDKIRSLAYAINVLV